jgi:Zn-dependent peptidase ImmA (M78 family)
MPEAGVNAAMLRWARERAGLSLGELRERIKQAWSGKMADWEAGRGGPTFEQARTLSSLLRAPLGYLFLDAPPAEDDVLPDLRTVGNERKGMSLDLRDVIMDAERKQAWLREHREEHDAPMVALVGCAKASDDPRIVAARLEHALALTRDDRARSKSWEDFLRLLVDRTERAGVVVLRSGQVGGSTQRRLDVEEFRGFALVDELAPMVFVNTQDVPPAQIFTLVHELAHLAIAVEGVSNAPVAKEKTLQLRAEEELCNRVAAELLLPQQEFESAWDAGLGLAENARRLAKQFKVSRLVVARRAFDAGFVSARAYWPFVRRQLDEARAEKDEQREREGGPDFFTMVKVRNGKAFTAEVVRAVQAGTLLYRDAARLLGVRPSHVDQLGV